MNQGLYSMLAMTPLTFASMTDYGGGDNISKVRDIKAKGRQQLDDDYNELIKDRKAIRKTNFTKSESQKRFLFNNLANMEQKRTLKLANNVS